MNEWLQAAGQNNVLMAAYAIAMAFIIPQGVALCFWLGNRVSGWIDKLEERRKR